MPACLGLRTIDGTNIGYVVLRDPDYEPERVAIGEAYVTRCDRLIVEAHRAGWVHQVHSARGVDAAGERVFVEFFKTTEGVK